MSEIAEGRDRRFWAIGIALLLIAAFVPLVSAPPAGAQTPPQLRAIPWDGCEPPCSYLYGVNGLENEVDKFRFRIEVESEHQPVIIQWSGESLAGNPASGALPADARIDGVSVGANPTVEGGTMFEWDPGEDAGSNEVNCYFPETGNTATGNCFWINITATDSLDQSTSVHVYLRVLEDSNPPAVEILDMSPPDGVVAIGETITFTVSGTDTDIPAASGIQYSLEHEGEPGHSTGATIDPNTGAFSWTPTSGQDGSYLMPILVREVDSDLPPQQLGVAFVGVPIVVGSGNRPPVVDVVTPVINVSAGEFAVTEFSYYDLDYPAQDLTLSLTGAPPGADVFPNDNPDTLEWQTTADDDGKRFEFTLDVTDGVGTTSVPITVNVGNVQTIQISITESVGVVDTVVATPPVSIVISESIGVADDVTTDPGVLIQIVESVGVSDTVSAMPPLVISITEAVGISDIVDVSPPIRITISETVAVADGVSVTPPVSITISESVGVVDSIAVVPPVTITISETVGVSDQVDVTTEQDPNADPDGDGIANSVDLQPASESDRFSDVPEGGSTFGTIINRGGLDLSVEDATDPADGVAITTGPGGANALATIETCSELFTLLVAPNTEAVLTCGSVLVEVLTGEVTIFTSDGARVVVGAGSSIRISGEDGGVVVEVLVGSAAIHDGDVVVVIEEGETLTDPGQLADDNDNDGLTGYEEMQTGTDAGDPDTDGDGLVDGIDASWLDAYVRGVPNREFRRRWLTKLLMRVRIAVIESTVRVGARSSALRQIDSLESHVDGCGPTPDRSDWIVDCVAQVEFRELLALYRRNVETMDLPDPWERSPWRE